MSSTEPAEAAHVRVARAANALLALPFPEADAFHLAAAVNQVFAEDCAALAWRCHAILEQHFGGWPAEVAAGPPGSRPTSFSDLLDGLSCVLERELEQADEALLVAQERARGAPPASAAKATAPLRHVAGLSRPQDSFAVPVDNSELPFLLPPPWPERGGGALEHPLREALVAWRPSAAQLACPAPTPPRPLDETPCTLVDTPEALEAMCATLRGCEALAVDLEAHSYRSYQGFTCLLQISSRSADWLVDTLALRGELRGALAGVMADGSITKVMHGADSDIVWLQRDFGVFLVNVFDTGQAARALALPSAGGGDDGEAREESRQTHK